MGAQVNVTDQLGITPYHLAVWRKNTEISEELVAMGARIDKPPEGAWFIKCMQPTEFIFSPGNGYVKKNLVKQ
jgi:hypothetical protein